MEYDGIKTFYKTLIEAGHSHHSIGNMCIREESHGIKVNGVFATASKVKDETHSDNYVSDICPL
jgi:hypothetical protein